MDKPSEPVAAPEAAVFPIVNHEILNRQSPPVHPSVRFRDWLCLVIFCCATLSAAPRTSVKLTVLPANPLLFGKGSRQALAAVVHYADGTAEEVTGRARFVSEKTSVATVTGAGVIRAEADGGARIRASFQGLEAFTTALVQRAGAPLPSSFAGDVLPVLTKIGCNGGNCHGALTGQNGFKLSLFGYEPAEDWEMIVRQHEGRRVNLPEPEKSLLLLKPTFQVAHGGSKRLRKESAEYRTLLEWIRSGARREDDRERRMVALRVTPATPVLSGKNARTKILVTARYSDGTEGDATTLVKFQSNDDSIVSVTAEGVATGLRGGETAVVARGPGVAAAAKIGVALGGRAFPQVQARNFIDEHVFAKLRRLGIPPSALADDAAFLRRAYLDVIGLIPTAEEARRFLADRDLRKREKLVDGLVERPEYADFWALYWGDHLSNTKQLLYNKGPYSFTRWLHDAFRANLPYDRFVRQLLVSSGNMFDTPATSFYPLMKKELDLAAVTSQLFLGVSIDCARCHNHPLERWTREDFNGMAAFFSQIRYKNAGPRNNERVLYLDFQRQFLHPETKQVSLPKPLDGPVTPSGEWEDRRELLADWLTSPRNPFFAKALVNRMWRNFMGRGLVEPVDDFRVTNPPSHEPLLEALAADFVEHGHDLRHLIRRITSSRAYQLSSIPVEGNQDDTMAHSRSYPRRLTAEQLLDSIAQATGVPEKFRSLYPGTRAAQLPEPEIESYFLEVFERPSRQLVCERKHTPTLNQALHMISGDTVHKKISDPSGVLARLVAGKAEPDSIVEDLYLRTLSRYPEAAEREMARTAIVRAGEGPAGVRRGWEDVFWALLNSKEFLYNH